MKLTKRTGKPDQTKLPEPFEESAWLQNINTCILIPLSIIWRATIGLWMRRFMQVVLCAYMWFTLVVKNSGTITCVQIVPGPRILQHRTPALILLPKIFIGFSL